MTPQYAKSISINNSARCNHRFPNGMRCRLIGFGSQPFCPKHTQPAVARQPDPAEIASTLTAGLNDFTSAAQINDFLSRLLLLLAQDKISTRRAAVLAYITNQILRTLPAIAKEENAQPTGIIVDMPGPYDPPDSGRSCVSAPQDTAATPDHERQEPQQARETGTNGRARA
jgi:hypothetical protein